MRERTFELEVRTAMAELERVLHKINYLNNKMEGDVEEQVINQNALDMMEEIDTMHSNAGVAIAKLKTLSRGRAGGQVSG